MLHYGKKSLFWSFIIFGYLSFTTVREQKSRFQQLWMYKIFKHRKLPCIPCLGETHIKLQWYNIFPSIFSFFLFCNATFFHSGYVIKPPPQPNSAIYGAPLFTGNHKYQQFDSLLVSFATCLCRQKSGYAWTASSSLHDTRTVKLDLVQCECHARK